MALRVYTQTNASTRQPGNRCVQWRILNKQLQRRDWSITWRTDGVVGAWRVVAMNIVNQTLNPQVRAFQLDTDPNKGWHCLVTGQNPCTNGSSRTLIVTLMVQHDTFSGQPVKIQSSLTGRNTEFGYPQNICSDVPPA